MVPIIREYRRQETINTLGNTRSKELAINTLAYKTTGSLALWFSLVLSAASQAQTLPICPKGDAKETIYGARCGVISVLENPLDPASSNVDVYTLRIPSIRDSNKPPIFFIAGGPGQASTDMASQFRYQFKHLLIDHDFIFIDQRGTGKSNPLECDMETIPYLDMPIAEVETLVIDAHKRCLKDANADLQYYTTPYAVQDLDDIRTNLGYEKIFLWGGSYGTRVVLEYLRQYPKSLTGVVMDGLAPVAISLPHYTARDASASLDNIFHQCETNTFCNTAFPDLKVRWLSALNLLAKDPVHVALKHPRSGLNHRVYVDDMVLSSWMRLVLYSRELATCTTYGASKQ